MIVVIWCLVQSTVFSLHGLVVSQSVYVSALVDSLKLKKQKIKN